MLPAGEGSGGPLCCVLHSLTASTASGLSAALQKRRAQKYLLSAEKWSLQGAQVLLRCLRSSLPGSRALCHNSLEELAGFAPSSFHCILVPLVLVFVFFFCPLQLSRCGASC